MRISVGFYGVGDTFGTEVFFEFFKRAKLETAYFLILLYRIAQGRLKITVVQRSCWDLKNLQAI